MKNPSFLILVFLFSSTESTVSQLKYLIKWLMENPGGLKLNSILSHALGNFFLYNKYETNEVNARLFFPLCFSVSKC
jgi:N-acetylglucosaminyl transferase component (Gpi1)